jgi:hypothetical protein
VTTDGIPEDVKRFIAEHVDSVEALEVLLLLKNNPDKEWRAEDVSRELYTQPESAAMRLAELESIDLLAVRDESGLLYRYSPGTGTLDQTVSGLSRAYKERRVTVISLIFSKPIDKIRTFADAFKIKREK